MTLWGHVRLWGEYLPKIACKKAKEWLIKKHAKMVKDMEKKELKIKQKPRK